MCLASLGPFLGADQGSYAYAIRGWPVLVRYPVTQYLPCCATAFPLFVTVQRTPQPKPLRQRQSVRQSVRHMDWQGKHPVSNTAALGLFLHVHLTDLCSTLGHVPVLFFKHTPVGLINASHRRNTCVFGARREGAACIGIYYSVTHMSLALTAAALKSGRSSLFRRQ